MGNFIIFALAATIIAIAWVRIQASSHADVLRAAAHERARAERDHRIATENWRDAELRHAQILRGIRRLQAKHPRLADEIARVVFHDGIN
jgi:heme exporter protein D